MKYAGAACSPNKCPPAVDSMRPKHWEAWWWHWPMVPDVDWKFWERCKLRSYQCCFHMRVGMHTASSKSCIDICIELCTSAVWWIIINGDDGMFMAKVMVCDGLLLCDTRTNTTEGLIHDHHGFVALSFSKWCRATCSLYSTHDRLNSCTPLSFLCQCFIPASP